MRYNLFLKGKASTWEEAKKRLIESISLAEERVGEDYGVAFPGAYDEKKHFVYEGELPGPYRLTESLEVVFYTDRESVEAGYRTLGVGEVLEGDNIKVIPSPGAYHTWRDSSWQYDIAPHKASLLSEIETEKERRLTEGFNWNGYQQRCRPDKDVPYQREMIENFKEIESFQVHWAFSNTPKRYLFTTLEEFKDLRDKGQYFTGTIFSFEELLKVTIENATSEDELNAIEVKQTFEEGLKTFY